MIIGKRQVILAALVLGLGIAVYLNWQYSKDAIDMPVTELIDAVGNYGEAQYVEGQAPELEEPDGGTFFVEAKMSRQKARDEAVETLAAMLQDAELDTEQRAQLAMRAADLADSIETEGKIENMIKAKGFEDVMVYFDTERADVIVKTDGLSAGEAAQIRDIILNESEIEAGNISIVEVN